MPIYDKDFMMYLNNNETHYCCYRLLHNSIKMFKSANIIKNIDKYHVLVESLRKKNKGNIDHIKNFDIIDVLSDDMMIDRIKIIMCFENAFKSYLIENKIIVHLLKKENRITIRNNINKPITFDEFFLSFDYNLDSDSQVLSLPYLDRRTLSYSSLTNNNYRKIINIPDAILKILNDINKKRNNHHLFHSDSDTFSDDEYNKYILLLKYFNNFIINKHNIIVDLINNGRENGWKREYAIDIP